MYRNRTCKQCNETLWTASRADVCLGCQKAEKKKRDIESEIERIKEWGYSVADDTLLNKHNHRYYTLNTPCNHIWKVTFTNLIKQMNVSKEKNLLKPCGVCGPKRRMKVALNGFMDKYARDYDLDVYTDYMKKVRGLTEVTYRKYIDEINPHRLTRGLNHGYHLDHKTPIIECFKQGWNPEEAASKENLELLPWTENLAKGKT